MNINDYFKVDDKTGPRGYVIFKKADGTVIRKNPWAEYLCPRVGFHERILWARAPSTEHCREVTSIDISVVIDVTRSSGSPLTQDHAQIRSVNLIIAVDISD